MKFKALVLLFVSNYLIFNTPGFTSEITPNKVNITPVLFSIEITHNGKPVTIQRNQDVNHRIKNEFALTSRECPPHCVQPIKAAPGVETVGELEVLDYLQEISASNQSVLLVDSRPPEMYNNGTIPGAINVNGSELMPDRAGDPLTIEEILTNKFGVKSEDGLWDFRNTKTLVLFCYGIWCGQATQTIDALIRLGYPEHNLKWYRGGLQAWESLGLTTIAE